MTNDKKFFKVQIGKLQINDIGYFETSNIFFNILTDITMHDNAYHKKNNTIYIMFKINYQEITIGFYFKEDNLLCFIN